MCGSAGIQGLGSIRLRGDRLRAGQQAGHSQYIYIYIYKAQVAIAHSLIWFQAGEGAPTGQASGERAREEATVRRGEGESARGIRLRLLDVTTTWATAMEGCGCVAASWASKRETVAETRRTTTVQEEDKRESAEGGRDGGEKVDGFPWLYH